MGTIFSESEIKFSKKAATSEATASEGPSITFSPVHILIRDDVLASRTYNSDEPVEFLFGLYGKPGFWHHNALMMTYCVEQAPGMPELRSVLLELFITEEKRTVLSVSKLSTPRDGYACKEYFITNISLGELVIFAQRLIREEHSEYNFLLNNCRHYSAKLFAFLKRNATTISSPFTAALLEEYYQRYRPSKTETRLNSHLTFSTLLSKFPLSAPVREPIHLGAAEAAISSSQLPVSELSAFLAGTVTQKITADDLSAVQEGAVLRLQSPDFAGDKYASYLGLRTDVLQVLTKNRGYLLKECNLDEIIFDEMRLAVERSPAHHVCLIFESDQVQLSDLDSHFLSRWKDSQLFTVDRKRLHAEKLTPAFPSQLHLLQRCLPLLGREATGSEDPSVMLIAAIQRLDDKKDGQLEYPPLLHMDVQARNFARETAPTNGIFNVPLIRIVVEEPQY